MFDFCVVGGGMVGSAMALGLAKLNFKVAIIEPSMPVLFDSKQTPDMRVSAISLTSEALLQDLGAWAHIKSMRLCPYKRLSVWDKPSCRTDFDCNAIEQPHLGHIIENRLVQLGLHAVINNNQNVVFYKNLKVTNITSTDASQVTLEDGQIIHAKILIGADGANSAVRDAANIGVQGWQYAQQALGIQIKTYAVQQDITWQQFTPDGPMAFLPLYDGFASLVWYHNAQDIKHLKSLSKIKLKQHILQHFPADLPDFEVLDVAAFPLTRMHANQYFKGNTVLIGDAAHTINPLAGQGVNLGFKDVAALLSVINKQLTIEACTSVLQPNHYCNWLKKYEVARRRDNLVMMSSMDLLYSTFSNNNMPLKILRNIGLKLANHSGPIKNNVMKYAMGLA
ncbi:FAD-dependent monooxygenase [Paraglaciecola psychrophila]|uniref:UbiH/UbiF/VisC/COQ6 family Ubiquinone biosynthesis hydroxylase n=1 Tax=Paraglaciecola psychrophila 170 TaxID=1129794 RepID=K6YZ67_9ALTE|nr:FAD-dependent monooxygenase [Paraglaciecola psychrophila]AGH45375.1 UbiH/UbiF/VisC/COQ6 family Ubiquinone biosynthesis hydroxylase [Paraglaciecola psychrophila 170]GAC38049.1 protein visC [Paraglaciecola psychrophila 170]